MEILIAILMILGLLQNPDTVSDQELEQMRVTHQEQIQDAAATYYDIDDID